jgi:hypothetical protein
MEEYPGICLSVDAWLKTKYFELFVGEHALHEGAGEQPAIRIQLHKLSTQKWEQFALIVNVLQEPSIPPSMFRNTSMTVPYSGTWT